MTASLDTSSDPSLDGSLTTFEDGAEPGRSGAGVDEQPIVELAGALRPVVLRLARRLRQMQDPSSELTASQSSVLGVLHRDGEVTMGELAAAEKVQPPTVTRLVKGLEERGLVTRTPAPHDGRQSLVALTEVGRSLLSANRRVRDRWLSERLAELERGDRELLERAVTILARVNHA